MTALSAQHGLPTQQGLLREVEIALTALTDSVHTWEHRADQLARATAHRGTCAERADETRDQLATAELAQWDWARLSRPMTSPGK